MTLSTVYSALVITTILTLRAVIMGLRSSLKKTTLPYKQQKWIELGTVVGLLVWLALTGFIAQRGVLQQWEARPPRLPFIPLFALLVIIGINREKVFRQLLTVTPAYWIIGLQVFRIAVEFCFWGLYKAGAAPPLVSFEGRNFDIIVGLTAPFIAFAFYKSVIGPRTVLVWNLIGLAILLNTIFVLLSAHPGPQHIDWAGGGFVAFGSWPFIWIPAFLAPLAIFLHLFSIRQMLLTGEKR